MRGYSRCSLYSRRSSSRTCMRRVEVARTRSPSVVFQSQWRRNYGHRGYPQVQDLYPLYPPSQRCGLCQHFKQTTLTTRLYKVRTNLYPPPLTKTFRRACPKLIPVRGSQPACDVSHKPGGRLSLLSARPAVTLATLKRAATSFAAR